MRKALLWSHGAKSLRIASKLLHALGLEVPDCLKGTGVEVSELASPDARISLEQEFLFYRNILELTADPLIGLQIGEQYRLADYGIWGFAVMSAPDLRGALERVLRFIALTYTCHDVALRRDQGTAVIELVPLRDYAICSQVITDRDAAAIYKLISEMLGNRLPLERVRLIHGASASRARYEAYFQCPVSFRHRCTELQFPEAVLSEPLPHSDPQTAHLTEHQCEFLVAQLDRHAASTAEIRRHLLARPGYFPSIEKIAEELGRSPRRLRRQLQVEGGSYSSLISELRYQLAREYIELSDLSIREIAALLGYSEPSNFTHAFRKWSGRAPAQYRAEREAEAALAQSREPVQKR